MGIKPGPKRIAVSTGKPDRRQRDNKQTPGNTPSLKPHLAQKGRLTLNNKRMPLKKTSAKFVQSFIKHPHIVLQHDKESYQSNRHLNTMTIAFYYNGISFLLLHLALR